MVQNADDAGASEVRILLTSSELLVTHNGAPIHLEHVLGLATPWLSTKAGDADSIGRFGLGLTTLRALSTTLEVHCAPYHIQIGDPTLAPIEPLHLDLWFSEPSWTTFRIPLQAESVQMKELSEWLGRWDDSSLLFLRHVTGVHLLESDGTTLQKLSLSRRKHHGLASDSVSTEISRETATTADGRSWALYSADLPVPSGVSRTQKATGSTTPVAVALPLAPVNTGQVYAGLPVAQVRSPLFANAQFDPLTNRSDFAVNPWNEALVALVASVWGDAVLDLFERDPHSAWHAIPLSRSGEVESRSLLTQALEAAVTNRARREVASQLSFPVPEQGSIALSQLAVEEKPLEEILQEDEVAQLAGLDATLPTDVRDPAGRWRRVLDDWRNHGADLPEPVSVERALDLVGDEQRSVGSTMALVAAALDEGLEARLLELPCLIAHDGHRLAPPTRASPSAVTTESSTLAEQLSVSTLLHSAYLAEINGAPEVLAWLGECGALLDASNDAEVIRRLAKAGQSGRSTGLVLSDDQLRTLRDAFERLDTSERSELGPLVGRSILLESYTYSDDGRKEPGTARPSDAYLPRTIDTHPESFAVAAERTPELDWLSDRYARTLRSQAGRKGIGPRRFLRLLGAEIAPRIRPHTNLEQRYQSERRLGLPRWVPGGPEARKVAMGALGATYTLDDYESQDLCAVVSDISEEKESKRRRARASALLSALDRSWEGLGEFAQVEAADTDYRWVRRGTIPSFWITLAGEVAWLDDESETPREPVALRVRTSATEAIFGASSPDFLHDELNQLHRRPLLAELGVSSDPSRAELVKRLQDLRNIDSIVENSANELRQETSLAYRALAQTLKGSPSESDMTLRELKRAFSNEQLVYTNQGWKPPWRVLGGPPIFGDLRAFVPAGRDSEPLWDELQIAKPSPNSCIEVLSELARRGKDSPGVDDEAVLLETLRALAEHYSRGRTGESKKLAKLALLTSMGWIRKRPVFATDDPVLLFGLGHRVPIWKPGGALEQFRSLFEPLGLVEIRTSEARIVGPELAHISDELLELYEQAVQLLREDLQRNDADLIEGLTMSWDHLAAYNVKVHPHLTIEVNLNSHWEQCQVNAIADSNSETVYVKNSAELARVDGGGRALAALFEGGARLVAQAWGAAYERAEEGIKAQRIQLAKERSEREEAEVGASSRLLDLQDRAAHKQHSSGLRRIDGAEQFSAGASKGEVRSPPLSAESRRVLVDPQLLTPVDPSGQVERSSPEATVAKGGGSPRSVDLSEPTIDSRGPLSRTPLRSYSAVDKENVGIEILKMLLSSDLNEIVDLRTQHGVGADAVDQLGNFYELKVYAGSEPDEITLTASEVLRAHSTPNFFLVVVSNVEGADARPTVRFVVDPLKQLRSIKSESVTLSGLQTQAAETLFFRMWRKEDHLLADQQLREDS